MTSCVKVSFVLMPFNDVWQPNLAVSILKQSLNNAGYSCDILYSNLDFSKRIGIDEYDAIIDKKIPFAADLLFRDYFNPNLNEYQTDIDLEPIHQIKHIVPDFIEDTAQNIINQGYNLIGFNVNFHTIPCLALSKRIKELSPETKIIFGGSNCDNEMGLALHENFTWIDFVCRGEGENLIIEVADNLSGKGKPLEQINGLIWRDNGISKTNGNKTLTIENLDTVPTPNFDDWTIQMKKHAYEKKNEEFILPFESSRGCWHGAKQTCIFCGLCAENQTYRIKSAPKVIDELVSFAEKYNAQRFFAMDLVFPHQYFDTFLPQIKQQHPNFRFGYEIRASATQQQLQALVEANITYVLAGIESLNSNMLKLLRKGTQTYQNLRILKWSFGMGMNVIWFHLYGCPGENTQDYETIIKLIPSISHLFPPKSLELIGLHRFAPLFEERETHLLKNIRPDKIYNHIYALPEHELRRLAYYFEYDKEPFEYFNSLNDAINNWRNMAGTAMFFYIEFEQKLYFYDTRPIARAQFSQLESIEKSIYLACDAGADITQIAKQTEITDFNQIQSILDKLCSENFIIYIDGKYLNLAINFGNRLFTVTEINSALFLYAEIYKTWMLAMINIKNN